MMLSGFLLVLTLAVVKGQVEQLVSQQLDPLENNEEYIGLGSNAVQVAAQPERRMDLLTYFMGGGLNNEVQTEQRQAEPTQILTQDHQPGAQVQIQQPNPNQLIVTRENNFGSGARRGLLTRMLMGRRTARLRRLSTMMQLLPMLVRMMGQIQIPIAPLQQQQQRSLFFNNRAGEVYNPMEVMTRPALYSKEQTQEQKTQEPQQQQQQQQKQPQQQQKDDQQGQQTRGYYYLQEEPNYKDQRPTQQLQDLKLGKYGPPETSHFDDFDDQPGNQFLDGKQTDYIKDTNINIPKPDDNDEEPYRPHDLVLSGKYENPQSQFGGGLSSGQGIAVGSGAYQPPISSDVSHLAGLLDEPLLVNFPVHKPVIPVHKPVIPVHKPVIPVHKPVIPIHKPIFPIHKPVIKPPPKPIVKPKPKPILKPAPEKLVPLGILPKPLLNINGKLFFGAELGKNAGVSAGR